MNGALIVLLTLAVIAVALLGFWVLTKVGFGPTNDPSAAEEEDADAGSH
jgi:flagellar basal body-associated protein FliL